MRQLRYAPNNSPEDDDLARSIKEQTVHMVSLGCPKNRVDSEVMLGHLLGDGYRPVPLADEADVIIVNTCGFIDEAKEESIDAILEMEDHKRDGRCTKLVVAGCLSQRYAPDLARELTHVDHFLGTGNLDEIAGVLNPVGVAEKAAQSSGPRLKILDDHARLRGANKLVTFRHSEYVDGDLVHIPDPTFTLSAETPRISTLPPHSRYVKISEGCSNTCSFCIIPKLRGPQRSRPIADILSEVGGLLDQGAVELNLIAQDLCAYGNDRDGNETLAQLLRQLDGLAAGANRPVWFRCLYAYPRGLTSKVMDAMADSATILPYLDMPLQHISDSMLRRMRRGKGGESTKQLLRRLRERIPNLTLRTTFITGMPGETEADFQELCELVSELRFENMGVFVYSPEDGTPAADMPDQVPHEVAQERRDALMALQRTISQEQQEALVGQELDVLVEGVSEETELLLQGRHRGQAPQIDGVTYINDGTASPGDVVRIRVEEATDYDVVGGIIG